ncbi:MAG: hypothetical protein JWO69_110 [Thermoleophilia bacterium]|nr:hypothetical protein [Thermoleophilia bacterium]
MQLILLIAATLAAGLLLLTLPGATLLALLRVDRVVPPPLVPAAALAMGFVPLGLLTAASLALEQPIWTITAGLAAFVLIGWWSLAARAQRLDGKSAAQGWATPVGNYVAGTWLRATPWGTWLVAAAAGGVAVAIGYFAWNDSIYHIGQAQKLLALDHPSFTNTLQFPDGSAHPGYLLPLWQEVLAQVAFIGRVDPTQVVWILPGVTVAIAALAMGGLGWTLARSPRAATPTALAWLLVACVGPLPLSDAILNSMHPGGIALWVLMPLVLALLLVALWPEHGAAPVRTAPAGAATRTNTQAATLIVLVAVAAFGVLHVSNLVILALGILGYLLVWALRAPWPRAVVLRHLAVLGSVGLVAAACVALLLPGLSDLQSFGKDAAAELQANESDLYEGKNGAPLESVVRGDVDGDEYHLRADYLVLGGGFALAGLLGLLLTVAAPRWPGGWLLWGSALLVLAVALTDRAFPRFVDVVSLDQARRIEKALPLAAGLGVGVLAVAAAALHLWRSAATAARASAVFLVALVTTGLWLLATRVLALGGYAGEQIVEPRVLTGVLAVLALAAAASLLLLIVSLVRGRARVERTLRLPSWEWPTALLTPGTGVLATAMLLVAAVPTIDRTTAMFDADRLVTVPTTLRTSELRVFSEGAAAELRKLEPGSMVLADPRTRDPYTVMAIAPVYVVSSVPRHTANTPKNRVEERFREAASFFDAKNGLTDAERRQVLVDNDVDVVIAGRRTFARDVLDRLDGVTLVSKGINQFFYRVD